MKEKRNRSCVVLLCLCLAFPIGAVADDVDRESFSNIFVFGDSLSDTGNAATAADAGPFLEEFADGNFRPDLLRFLTDPNDRVALCFPDIVRQDNMIVEVNPDFPCDDLFFMNSRVSNGPVAVEVLAKRLGFGALQPSLYFWEPLRLPLLGLPRPFVGTNYAVAGATAQGSSLADLNSQVLGFLLDHGLFSAPQDALYVVIIGGNDIIAAVDAPEGIRPLIITNAVNAIASNIDALIEAGARRFLVANSLNIGSVPAAGMDADLATSLAKEFNQRLAERLDQVRVQRQQLVDLEIKEFNLFRFFEVVRRLGRLLGVFVNIDEACFESGAYRDFGRPAEFHPDCGPSKFDRFVFFDDLHPTGLVHRIVGKALSVAARRLAN